MTARLFAMALSAWALLVAPTAVRAAESPPEADAIVLVVSARSPVDELDAVDIKRLFLGIPLVAGDVTLRAVLNFSDERLRAVFYQHVVGMTGAVYERRLLQLTLEQGRRMPGSGTDDAALLALLERDPGVVSFTWRSHVAQRPGLRVVRELWHP